MCRSCSGALPCVRRKHVGDVSSEPKRIRWIPMISDQAFQGTIHRLEALEEPPPHPFLLTSPQLTRDRHLAFGLCTSVKGVDEQPSPWVITKHCRNCSNVVPTDGSNLCYTCLNPPFFQKEVSVREAFPYSYY